MATKKSTTKKKPEAKVKVYKRIGSLVKSENFIPFGNDDAMIEKIKSRKQSYKLQLVFFIKRKLKLNLFK